MPTLIASLLRKAALLVLMLLALSLAVFYISRLTPGDPLQSYYGDAVQSMSSAELDAARRRLGLDGPIWEQYQRWAGNVLDGDFGMSLKYKRPVVDVVLPLLGNTLLLGGLAYALVFVLAIALALLCARFEHSALDRLICRVGTTAYYVPAFWLGVLLVLVFSVNLEWLPSSGAYSYGKAGDIADRARHLVLPLAVMVASHLWYYAYMIRNKLLDEVRRDYVPGPHPRALEPLPAQRHAHGGGHHGHLHPACAQRHLCGRSRVQLSRHRPAGHLQRQVSRLQPAHAHGPVHRGHGHHQQSAGPEHQRGHRPAHQER